MSAMPAKKWTSTELPTPELKSLKFEEHSELDYLIEEVAYYRELTFEYPMTMEYRSRLEVAEDKLRRAEKRA